MGVKVRMIEEKPQSMCLGCKVRCCTLTIDMTVYDMARLAVFAGKRVEDFLQYADAEPDEIFAFRSLGKLVKLILRKKEDGLCMYFDASRGLYCTVEDAKPSACLAYPMELAEDGRLAVRKDAMCPAGNLKRADYVKMSREVVSNYIWERDRHAEFVADWNMSARGDERPEAFLKFAASEAELERTAWGRAVRRAKRGIRLLRRRI